MNCWLPLIWDRYGCGFVAKSAARIPTSVRMAHSMLRPATLPGSLLMTCECGRALRPTTCVAIITMNGAFWPKMMWSLSLNSILVGSVMPSPTCAPPFAIPMMVNRCCVSTRPKPIGPRICCGSQRTAHQVHPIDSIGSMLPCESRCKLPPTKTSVAWSGSVGELRKRHICKATRHNLT